MRALHQTHAMRSLRLLTRVIHSRRLRDRRQSRQRIVLAHRQPKFTARREQAIRLIYTTRHEIIHEHTDVTALATKHDGVALQHGTRRVQSGHHALTSRLFIASGAVYLPGKPQPLHGARGECRIKLCWRIVVVFNRITRARHAYVLKSANGTQHLQLHRHRQRRRQTVHIQFGRVMSFRFQKQLMSTGVRKLHHFVLNTRAIPRTT